MARFSRTRNELVREEHDHCKHLKLGDRSYVTLWEHDRFGPVSAKGLCKSCFLSSLTPTEPSEWEEYCGPEDDE